MDPYHKIQSAWKRDPETNYKTFLPGQWTLDAFEYLANNEWLGEEKIDGTNIRVMWDGEAVTLNGRTDRAQLPMDLVRNLNEHFTAERMSASFDCPVTLYGEGYGAGIQKGGGDYRQDKFFILFDVLIGGMWLERHNVYDVAEKLDIPHAPHVFRGTLDDAVEMVRGGFRSLLRETPPEGLVLRPLTELTDRFGNRMITKLKIRDFQNG